MKCKVCKKEFNKNYGKYSDGRFCSRKCANTRHHSKKTIESIRNSCCKYLNNHPPVKVRFKFVCPHCNEISYIIKSKIGIRKTCGKNECVSKQISNTTKLQINSGIRVNNWGGRCKKFKYVSISGTEINVDGSFELEFCKWCDRHKIQFVRNRIGFKYTHEGKEHSYFPDFCINDSLFVETKGYETSKDKSKWSQFPYPIIILRKKQIRLLKKDLINDINSLKQFIYK